jgi:XTP/dITP diphosphohydrolase
MTSPEPGFGIYVHWPFCAAKCPYCDFNSHVRHDPVDQARFARALGRELAHFAALTPGRTVGSIFFGGGTPSLMEASTVGAVLDAIGRHWAVASDVEVSLEANAAIKALAAALASGLPALADDSGLCVAALGGQPGVHSARWAGEDKDFGRAMRNIEELVAQGGTGDRRAHFVAALCLAWPDGHTETVRGEIHGTLVWPPRGGLGFGYDPMFLPEGESRTFGEMSAEEKHGLKPGEDGLSHRARAFSRFARRCL